MIDISDGNSILHQHQVVNLLALLKEKSLNNVLLMFCRASPFWCYVLLLQFLPKLWRSLLFTKWIMLSYLLHYCFPNCLATILEQQWLQTAEHPAHFHSIIIILMFCTGSMHVNIEILPFWISNCSSPGATALWALSSTFNILKTAIHFQFLLFKRNQPNSRTWSQPDLC